MCGGVSLRLQIQAAEEEYGLKHPPTSSHTMSHACDSETISACEVKRRILKRNHTVPAHLQLSCLIVKSMHHTSGSSSQVTVSHTLTIHLPWKFGTHCRWLIALQTLWVQSCPDTQVQRCNLHHDHGDCECSLLGSRFLGFQCVMNSWSVCILRDTIPWILPPWNNHAQQRHQNVNGHTVLLAPHRNTGFLCTQCREAYKKLKDSTIGRQFLWCS